MRRALFIPSTQGLGHVMRCRALAAELHERGWACSTSGSKRPPGFEGEVVVVDGELPADCYDWPCPVVAIRDRPYDHSIRNIPLLYVWPTSSVIDSCLGFGPRTFYGTRWAMVRSEFLDARRWDSSVRAGYFDARTVDEGRYSAAQMAAWMGGASLVVTYAGVRAMEAACVGVPMILLARNAGEIANALGFSRSGAAIYVQDDEAVEPMIERLRKSPERLERMGRIAQERVDGLGACRIADEIEEEVGHGAL